MDKKDLKQIETILDKKLDGKLDQKLKPISQKLDEHSSKLDALVLDMADVQRKTDAIPDIHSYIKDTSEKVRDHEERIEALEAAA